MNKLKNDYIIDKRWPKKIRFNSEEAIKFQDEDGEYEELAYFEVFLTVPSTFIRCEGKTIKEAEASAFQKYQNIINCKEHKFERMQKSNHGICIHCKLFQTDILDSIDDCELCNKKSVYLHSYNLKKYLCTEHFIFENDKIDDFNSENIIEKINNKNFNFIKYDRVKYLKIKALIENNTLNFEKEENFNKLKGFKSDFHLFLHNLLISIINENKNLKFSILALSYLKDSLVFYEDLYKNIYKGYFNGSEIDKDILLNHINEFSIKFDDFFIKKYGSEFIRKIIQN